MGKREPAVVRLWRRTVREGECLVWTGAKRNGYGVIGLDDGSTGQTHRLAYEAVKGPIPEGLHIDHLCRNRSCVNPDHLEAVTQAENNLRAARANRRTHCKRGHEFTEANTMTVADNMRNCRTCRNQWARDRRALRSQQWTEVSMSLAIAERERVNDSALAAFVVAKRHGTADPGSQVVLMTLADLVALLTGARPETTVYRIEEGTS